MRKIDKKRVKWEKYDVGHKWHTKHTNSKSIKKTIHRILLSGTLSFLFSYYIFALSFVWYFFKNSCIFIHLIVCSLLYIWNVNIYFFFFRFFVIFTLQLRCLCSSFLAQHSNGESRIDQIYNQIAHATKSLCILEFYFEIVRVSLVRTVYVYISCCCFLAIFLLFR